MDFVTIDFETATPARDSPCEIGLTFVEGGKIIETKSWLIKPKYEEFHFFNMLTHKIKPEDVTGKPTFGELWTEISPLVNGRQLVAHNASFDISVLRRTLETYRIPLPSIKYYCSYLFSKKVWEGLSAYDLKTLCKVHSIDLLHHRAGPDSRATAELALMAFSTVGMKSLDQFTDLFQLTAGELSMDKYRPCGTKRVYNRTSVEITGDVTKHNPDCIFYGQTVVFTGTLSSMPRSQAHQVIADIGGIVGKSVTRDTNYLVVGQQDYRVVGEQGMSSKQVKAIQQIAKGFPLEILSEEEFLKSL